MKSSTLIYLLTFAISLLIAGNLIAETKFSYDGQIRLRDELDLKSFDEFRHGATFADLRTRVGLKFEKSENALAYIQFQDSRRLGESGSGNIYSTDNVDLHQAYFELKHAIWEWLYLKAGRFEFVYGNQRVFGSVGWHNIGRSWEGGIASIRPGRMRLDLFWLKKMEMNSEYYNRDFDIVGFYTICNKMNIDFFGFYEFNADSTNYVQPQLKRFNFGAYLHQDYDDFDLTLQGNYQLGEMPNDTIPNSLVQDISAFMINADIGLNFDGERNARVSLGIDYTSGDNGSDSTKYKSYTNSYYTGHAFRGHMDYFIGSPVHGLIDIVFKAKGNLAPKWLLKGDFHYFKAAKNYVSLFDDSTLTSNIGMEVDLAVVTKIIHGATLTGGASLFVADEHFTESGVDRNAGFWVYTMTTIDF